MFHRKPPPQQEVRGLVLRSAVPGLRLRVPPGQQVASVVHPIAFESIHCKRNGLAAEAMRAQFGADESRPITGTGPVANHR